MKKNKKVRFMMCTYLTYKKKPCTHCAQHSILRDGLLPDEQNEECGGPIKGKKRLTKVKASGME